MMKNDNKNTWNSRRSSELYSTQEWAADFFTIGTNGQIRVKAQGNQNSASLLKIIDDIKEKGLDTPVLLRFSDILEEQISRINNAFLNAIKDVDYQGDYRGVYPIKVNQQQHLLQDIVRFGKPFHYGLEAGSKAELLAALSFLEDPEACLVCNGYKDREFIDLALHATKLGVRCFIVIEMPRELPLILERAQALGIEPLLGVRLKLASQAGGYWTQSGGDRSVFGLNSAQVINLVDQLKEAGQLNCLKLLHYHLGSQVPNIRDIRHAVTEASRIYTGLVQEGAPMGFLDIGGGLAIDYDGSAGTTTASCNYSIKEYAVDVIEVLMTTLAEKDIPHPTLISEFGRATVAHSSVLIFNILESSHFNSSPFPQLQLHYHNYCQNLWDTWQQLDKLSLQESYNDATYYRDEVRQLFKHGNIDLRQRAAAESIFWHIMHAIADRVDSLEEIPEEFIELRASLSAIYYGNFSIFQSLPDSWAIDQVFPVMPIHRLHEEPTKNAIISDITCDSDGVLDHFIDHNHGKGALPVHPLIQGQDYYLGAFLVGAYQETLGDLHNLLGDTNVVSIKITGKDRYEIEEEIHGDSVAEVLRVVEYDTEALLKRLSDKAENALQNGSISKNDKKNILKAFHEGLDGYTYFEH